MISITLCAARPAIVASATTLIRSSAGPVFGIELALLLPPLATFLLPSVPSVPVEPEFKDYDPALLGKWDRDDDLGGYIIFNGDGTGFLQDTAEDEVLNFTYKANGTIAKIKPDNMEEINMEYSFEEDELLVFVNKGLIRYFKQEESTD